jgi:putative DNA primase/helicase
VQFHPSILTDTGNAQRFVEDHGEIVRYVHSGISGEWIVWDGTRWKPDATKQAMELAKETAMGMYRLVADNPQWLAFQQDDALKWARQSLHTTRLTALLKAAQSDPRVAITPDMLDTHIYLLPCANGTLDLRTFELRAADPADYMTKSTGIDFDPNAILSSVSSDFLSTITCGDDDLEMYLQKILGYTLTGDTSRRLVWFLHGPGGRNGKSTLLEQVRYVLGDFAQVVPVATLEKQKFSKGVGATSSEIANLKGARFVTASESEQDMHLSAAKIKELAGNETIYARQLYLAGFTFAPQFKLFLATNYRPNIPARDSAVWHRLRLIPFNHVIAPDEVDLDLSEKLRADAVAWLGWMASGLLLIGLNGLDEPQAVLDASQNYREDMDTFGEFVEQLRQLDEDAVNYPLDYGLSTIFLRYQEMAAVNGWEKLDSRAFNERMLEYGFTKTLKHPRRWEWPADRHQRPEYTIGELVATARSEGWDWSDQGE